MNLFSEFLVPSHEEWLAQIQKDLKGKSLESTYWKFEQGIEIAPYALPFQAEHSPESLPISRANLFHTYQQGWQLIQPISVTDKEAISRLQEDLAAETNAFLLTAEGGEDTDFIEIIKHLPTTHSAIHIRYPKVSLSFFEDLNGFMQDSGQRKDTLTGTFTTDFPVKKAEEMAAIIQKTESNFPNFKVLGIAVEEGESGIVLQLALALAKVVDYVETLKQQGLSPEEVFRQFAFTFPIGGAFFPEIAKLRAFRTAFARVGEEYGLKAHPFIMTVSSATNLAHYDIHTNLLRLTTEAMSGIMGGTNGLCLLPYDHSVKSPNALAHRISRNIQHLLRYESYMDKVTDPVGGAGYVEALTHTLLDKSWALFQEIEKNGGYFKAKESGWLAAKNQTYMASTKEAIAKRRQVFIGINQYPDTEEISTTGVLSKNTLFSAFETLRNKTDQYTTLTAKRPSVHLLLFGEVAMRNARALFSRNLIGCAGYAITEGLSVVGKPAAIVLCSDDDSYFTEGKLIIEKTRKDYLNTPIFIAGKPENIEILHADGYLFAGIQAIDFLTEFQQKTGIF